MTSQISFSTAIQQSFWLSCFRTSSEETKFCVAMAEKKNPNRTIDQILLLRIGEARCSTQGQRKQMAVRQRMFSGHASGVTFSDPTLAFSVKYTDLVLETKNAYHVSGSNYMHGYMTLQELGDRQQATASASDTRRGTIGRATYSKSQIGRGGGGHTNARSTASSLVMKPQPVDVDQSYHSSTAKFNLTITSPGGA